MNYDRKYADIDSDQSPDPNIAKTEHSHQALPCEACGTMTCWFHNTFIAHICSEECRQALPWMYSQSAEMLFDRS